VELYQEAAGYAYLKEKDSLNPKFINYVLHDHLLSTKGGQGRHIFMTCRTQLNGYQVDKI